VQVGRKLHQEDLTKDKMLSRWKKLVVEIDTLIYCATSFSANCWHGCERGGI